MVTGVGRRRAGRPAPGEHGIMIAFGPGLTTEAALLRF
jgi:predicted naringenin-chalcone synthase